MTKQNTLTQLFQIIILLIFQKYKAESTNLCGIGCKNCQLDQQNIYQCLSCSEGFDYNQTNKACVYKQCAENLFYQEVQNQQGENSGTCVLICDQLYEGNEDLNVCEKLQECSSSFATNINLQSQQILTDIFIYQNFYYVIIYQQGYLSIYDKEKAFLVKHLNYMDGDLSVQNINQTIFVFRNDQTISTWDLITEERVQIFQGEDSTFDLKSQVFNLQESFVLFITKRQSTNNIEINLIYDLNINQLVNSKEGIIINIQNKKPFLIKNGIVLIEQNFLTVKNMMIQNTNNSVVLTSQFDCIIKQELQAFIFLVDSSNLDSFYAIYENGIVKINLFDNSCSIILNLTKIISVKQYSNPFDHLIIQTSDSLFDFDCSTKISRNIIFEYIKLILDFDVGNYFGNNNLLILTSTNILYIHNLIDENQTFSLIDQKNIYLQGNIQIKKMISTEQISQNENQKILCELALFSDEIQIIRQIKGSASLNLEEKIIKNYQLQYPTAQTEINSLLIIQNSNLVVTCHINGDIIFYNTSSGYHTELIQVLSFVNQSCLKLDQFKGGKLAALMNDRVMFINPNRQEIENEIIFSNKINNLMTINSNYIVINSSNCIEILNQEFIRLFNVCAEEISSNNVNIAFNNDMKLITFKKKVINVYQININDSQYQLIKQIQSEIEIIFFCAILQFSSEQNKIDNDYIIDEIVTFDQNRSFRIYDINLNLVKEVDNVGLISINQVKRTINDNNVYFLIGQSFTPIPVVQMELISKMRDAALDLYSFQTSPYIDDPIKMVNDCGTEYYHIKQIIQVNYFTVHEEFMIDLNKNQIYVYGHDYMVGADQTLTVKKTIGSSKNDIDYALTKQGLVGIAKWNKKRYQAVIQAQDQEIIQEVIQSATIGIYFVRSNKKISSYNIFTNEFIEDLNPQLPTDPIFNSFQIIESIQSIICISNNQILLKVYGDENKQYFSKEVESINGWIFNDSSKLFYVYGSSLVVLDQQLNLLKTIQDPSIQFLKCLESQMSLICSISITSFAIIDKINFKIVQIVSVKGFNQQFQIGIDEEMDNLFLYEVSIQIFSLMGLFKQTISPNHNVLNTFGIHDTFIVLFSKSNRTTLLLQDTITPPNGLNIINYLYVWQLKKIVLYCNTSLFASLYIYNIQNQQLVGKISSPFFINQYGVVLDMAYDESSSYIQFLDDQANYYIFALYGEYTVINNFKLTEVLDRKEALISFTYNNQLNNVLIYSKSYIYQINYSTVGFKYQFGLNEPSQKFSFIRQTNDNQNEYLLVSNPNMIFRYSQQSLIFENVNSEIIQDIRYDIQQDILIIACQNQVQFFMNYQSSINNNIKPKEIIFKPIQFFKFITSSIYLTFDKKIIHVNIQSGEIIQTIQLDETVFVTSFKTNSSQDIIFIGLSNGSLLSYNLTDQAKTFYSISDSSNINKAVNFIQIDDEDKLQQKLLFATNGGVVVEINLQTKLKNYEKDLIQLTNQELSILMVGFEYDKLFKRYIFFFSGEKKTYVWNEEQNTLEKYLILTNDQGNYLKLTSQFIITQCSFQLNIYSRQKNINLITFIQRNNFNDFIASYEILNDNFIAIFFSYKYEVFLIQGNKNILIDQKQYLYPRFMGSFYNPQTNFMKIYGLHSKGVFEENYSLNIYSHQNSSKCSSIIESDSLTKTKQLIQSISPKMKEIFNIFGRTITKQDNWSNIIFLNVYGEDFYNINQFISQPQFTNTNIILSPFKDTQNNLFLQSKTLASYSQEEFILNKFNFIYDQDSQNLLQLKLSPQVQNLRWQTITILKQITNKININIDGLKKIIMKNIIFDSLKLYQEQKNSQDTLITIQNTDEVLLYDINIINSQFTSNTNQTIFSFININTIIIDGLNIQDNQDIYQCFLFQFVKNIIIKNVKILSNKQFGVNSLNNRILTEIGQSNKNQTNTQAIFSFFGCSNIKLSNFEISNNLQLLVVYTNNEYQQSDNTITFVIDQLLMENIEVNNNIIDNNKSLFYLQCQYIKIIAMQCQQNTGNLLIKNSKQIQLENSLFKDNIALKGGAISFINIEQKIEFQTTNFFKNTALSSGGSLYFEDIENCEILFDNLSQITNNTALIGGGIRVINSSNQNIILPQNYPFSDNIKDNKAGLYGDNAATYLQQIIVENLNDQFQATNYLFNFSQDYSQIPKNMQNLYQQLVQLQEFQSGSFLRLRIYLVDNYNRKLTFSKELLANSGYPNDVESELKNIQILIESLNLKETQLLGEKILNYDQYNSQSSSFELRNLQIQAPLNSQQYFIMNSNIFATSNIETATLIDINFRKCSIGEIIQDISNNIQICKYCQSGSYSLINPNDLYDQTQNNQTETKSINKNECKLCPDSALNCQGNKISIKNGFWRSSPFSDEILECDQKIGSCQAESSLSSFEGCSEGYIGPLCEECDIIGQVWNKTDKRYSSAVQKGICQVCSSLSLQSIYLILKVICMLIYFTFTLKYTQRCYYLRIMQILPISKNSIKDYSGFYIKIIITYLQISSLLISQPKILPNLNILNDIIGSSNKQIGLGVDCMFSYYNIKQEQKLVLQSLIQAAIPVVLIFLMMIKLSILSQFKKIKITKYHYITFLHIHLNFFQLEQISFFSKSLTCRQIGSKSYSAHDLTTECQQSEYQTFLTVFAVLMLLMWSLLPFYIIYLLQKNKNKLYECKVKYMYGFYYAELKSKYYYWEFVRMYMKISIIYIHILLSRKDQSISSQVLIFIFTMYAMFVAYQKPFISTKLTASEVASSLFIVIKIFLSNLQGNMESTQLVSEIIIALVDYVFIAYFIVTIIIFKANDKSSKSGQFIRWLLQFLPKVCSNKILNLNQVKFQTYLNWKFVKSRIQNIIHLKANQNINGISNKIQSIIAAKKRQSATDNLDSLQQLQKMIYGEISERIHETDENLTPQSCRQQNSNDNKLYNLQNYQLLQIQNDQQYQDQVIENISDQLESSDPKKVEVYSFYARNSILSEQSSQLNNLKI